MSSKLSNNSINIISRLKLIFKIKTDSGLASLLGVKQNTITGWKTRDSIDYKLIFSKLDNVNFHWLLTGEGEMNPTSQKSLEELSDIPDLGGRLRFARQNMSLTQEELAKHAETTKSLIEKLEETSKIPKDSDACTRIARVLQVSTEWLFFKEGDIYIEQPVVVNTGLNDLDETSREIFAHLKNMNEDKKKEILNYIKKETLFDKMYKQFTGGD